MERTTPASFMDAAAVGTGVVQGIATLNPQRWVGNSNGAGASRRGQ